MDNMVFPVLYTLFLVALLAFGLVYLLRLWYFTHKSEATRRFVTKVFRRHGALREWRVLDNVTVGKGDAAVMVDHLVAGPFGVIIACDLHQKGNVYGEMDAENWILTDGEDGREKKRETIPSPYYRVRCAEQQLRTMLAANKIYNVPVEVVVPKTMKQYSYITGSDEYLLSRSDLKNRLQRSKYDKDNGIDIQKITAMFENN